MLCVEDSLWPMRPVYVVARSAAIVCLLSFTYSSIKSRFTASNRRHKDQSTSQLHVAPPGSHMSRIRTARYTVDELSKVLAPSFGNKVWTQGAETRRKATTGWPTVCGLTRGQRLTWSATVGLSLTSLCLLDCSFVCHLSAQLVLEFSRSVLAGAGLVPVQSEWWPRSVTPVSTTRHSSRRRKQHYLHGAARTRQYCARQLQITQSRRQNQALLSAKWHTVIGEHGALCVLMICRLVFFYYTMNNDKEFRCRQ